MDKIKGDQVIKIILMAALIISANAYECEMKDDRGGVYRTISSTYKDNGDSRSMWFEFSRNSKKVLVESGKSKKEAFKDKMLKDAQGITYGKDKKVKSQWDGKYFDPKEVVPGTIGEWMWDVLNHWAYVHENSLSKKEVNLICEYAAAGILAYQGYGIGEERVVEHDSLVAEEYKQPSMTPEETRRWLEENDPRIKR